MPDTLKIINNRISAMNDLYARMDKTKDYLYWKYSLKNFEGQKIDKAISVTPNQPAVFAHAIIADLMGGKWQTVIEGKLTGKQAHTIEGFIDDNFSQADEFLLRKFGMSSLFAWLCNHVCIRSFIGVRWLSQIEGEGKETEYKIDCLPVDMRWTPFEFGKDGLKWVAPRTFRSVDSIREEYPGASVSGTGDIEVRDYWDDEKNEVWIGEELVKEQKNPLGYPPFVIAIPPSGFMLRDKGYLEHEGEDLLFLNRGLYDELARAISIEQTLGMDIIAPPYEYETKNPDGKPPRRVPKSGEVGKVPEGERHIPVPRGDMNTASMTARADIQRMIQQGGISDVDLGIFATSPPSALLITTETEIRGKLLNPRLETLGILREGLARMMIDQYIKASKGNEKSSLLVGKRGRKVQYSLAQMGDPDTYTISCQLMTKSKRQEIANLAMAGAARGTLPLKVILRDVLMADDPDGIMRELELEEAKRADPAIALHEMALRCIEEAEEIEDDDEADAKLIQAKMLTERGVSIIKQRQQPVLPEGDKGAGEPKVEAPKGDIGRLLPLLGEKGMRGGGDGKRGVEEALP